MRRWASWWLSLWLHLVVLSGRALPPGIGPGNAQMGQLVAGTIHDSNGDALAAEARGEVDMVLDLLVQLVPRSHPNSV